MTDRQSKQGANALLALFESVGGKSDIDTLCTMLYLADQRHLTLYGRSITGDTYIARKWGAEPTVLSRMASAMTTGNDIVCTTAKHDMDELSASDIECLTYAADLCRDASRERLRELSHGKAWSNTPEGCEISVKDILLEAGDEEEYAEYIERQTKAAAALKR